MSWLLAAALAVAIAAHVVIVVSIARRALWRAPLAVIIPPLAPYWGWQLGLRRRVLVWWAAVLLYALGTIVLAR